MATITKEESDYDSSSSSLTNPESHRSWMSSRRSSISISSETSFTTAATNKPHKANQASYEAMKRLQISQNGKLGLEHFRLMRRLGSGDIGNVYLCEIRNPVVGLGQCYYAMKVVDREALAIRKKLQRADIEKEILNMLDHPFLPTLFAEFDASHYSCLVMEFCPGGDLYAARQRLPSKRFSLSSAKFYAAETILALEYLHMMGIVYRDLKPENVLVREDGHIMLSDFDLSLKCDVVPKILRIKTTKPKSSSDSFDTKEWCSTPVLSCFLATKSKTKPKNSEESDDEEDHKRELVAEPINARSKSFVGTHEYLAPEVISGQGHGSSVDWWTLGVFLYEMVYGKTPFKGENNEKTLMNILKSPLGFPRIGVSSSKEIEEMAKFEDLIRKLLVKNPKRRIGSLMGSLEIKRHEFFKGVNWALIRSCKPPQIPSERIMGRGLIQKLSKKERDQPYQIPLHFDYF